MVGVSIDDVEVINQVFDEEEAPATRCLQLGELGFQVGRLRLDGGGTFSLVGDAYRQRAGGGQYLNDDRNIGLVMIAVFHCIHGSLSYSRLELFQPPGGQVKVSHGPGHLFHSLSLISWNAGYAKFGERVPVLVVIGTLIL